jgi:regulatory protein
MPFSKKTLQTPLNRALKYLSLKNRSVKEMTDYLTKKDYDEDDIKKTIDKLLELNFLNDDTFSKSFVVSRQLMGKSKRTIEFELKLKGVEKEKTEEILEDAKSDFKTAFEYILKRLHQFERYDAEEKQKKIISRLRSRGFSWDTISKVLKKLNI